MLQQRHDDHRFFDATYGTHGRVMVRIYPAVASGCQWRDGRRGMTKTATPTSAEAEIKEAQDRIDALETEVHWAIPSRSTRFASSGRRRSSAATRTPSTG